MPRYGLRDDQWQRIKDLLPGRIGHVGVTAQDNRRFVEAVLYRYRAGIPWRDLPERFGDWKNIHRRFSRWATAGVSERVFEHGRLVEEVEATSSSRVLFGAALLSGGDGRSCRQSSLGPPDSGFGMT
jgi:transposase